MCMAMGIFLVTFMAVVRPSLEVRGARPSLEEGALNQHARTHARTSLHLPVTDCTLELGAGINACSLCCFVRNETRAELLQDCGQGVQSLPQCNVRVTKGQALCLIFSDHAHPSRHTQMLPHAPVQRLSLGNSQEIYNTYLQSQRKTVPYSHS